MTQPDDAPDTRIQTVLEALMRREPIFHRPEFGTTRADFARMTEASFWEIGASGRIYTREEVLDVLAARHAQPHEDRWATRDFHCQALAPDLYLLSYTLAQGERLSRRTTLWRWVDDDWKIVFHQGTLIAPA